MNDPALTSRVARLIDAIEHEHRDVRLAVEVLVDPLIQSVNSVVDSYVTAQGLKTSE